MRDVEAGGGQRVGELAREALVERGEHDRGAVLEHLGGVGGAAEHGDRAGRGALGGERRRQRAERRHQALGDDQHAGAARDPLAVRGEHRGQRLGGDGQHDEIVALEVELGGAQDADRLRQLDAGQVAGVLARVAEAPRPARGCGSRGRPRSRREPGRRPGWCPRCRRR